MRLSPRKSSLDVEAEAVQAAWKNEQFKSLLVEYVAQIWATEKVPAQWAESQISPLWKRKGSPSDPATYRGIALGPILVKLFMNVLMVRMKDFYEGNLLKTQFGFREGKGCNDGIFVMKQLQSIAVQQQKELYTCYVDLTAAYDHINRVALFTSMKARISNFDRHGNDNHKAIRIIEGLYSFTTAYIKGDAQEESFEFLTGVRQGGNESPQCYNFFADYAIRDWRDRCLKAELPGLEIPYFIVGSATSREQREKSASRGTTNDSEGGFADDTGVHAWSLEVLQKKLEILFNVFKEYGLTMNIGKTKTMVWNWKGDEDSMYPASIIEINGKKVENVKTFKYLGVWNSFGEDSIGSKEMNYRIGAAAGAFAEHKKLLTNKNIWLKTRVKYLNAYVRSRLIYGCQS